MNRYQRKLEDKKALRDARLTQAKARDGSQREIDARLHKDGRSTMEAPLNLSSTAVPPSPNQAVPKAQLLLLDGSQQMGAPLTLPDASLPPDPNQAIPKKPFVDVTNNLQDGLSKKANENHKHGFDDVSGVAREQHSHGKHSHSYKYFARDGTAVTGKTTETDVQ